MAMSLSVDISREAENPQIAKRFAVLKGDRLNKQIARGVQQLFQKHLFALDAVRINRLGGKRTNFYSDAAKATSGEGDASGATITVSQLGFRQRLQGGTIRPTNGKYLTIPARAEAHGRRAREFANLKFVSLGNGRGMLVADDHDGGATKRKRIGAREKGLAYYWLVPEVTQRGDASVIPSEPVIRGVIAGIVEMALNRDTRRPGA